MSIICSDQFCFTDPSVVTTEDECNCAPSSLQDLYILEWVPDRPNHFKSLTIHRAVLKIAGYETTEISTKYF